MESIRNCQDDRHSPYAQEYEHRVGRHVEFPDREPSEMQQRRVNEVQTVGEYSHSDQPGSAEHARNGAVGIERE